jgi:two-component system sensor histidine kinase KdpD
VSPLSRADDDMLRLAVENEGIGIPVELRERVFDKFFRAMRDGDSGTSGTGMGLAIARGIVEAHGGRIWVEDRNGPGRHCSCAHASGRRQGRGPEVNSLGA